VVRECVIGSTDLPLRVLEHLRWYHIVAAPVLGGLIVGLLIRYLAPEAEGHGVPEVIEAVMLRGGRIRRRVAAVKAIASAVTIGSGGSVGREGPIVQIGAAVGSAIGQFLRFPPEQLRTLAACGSAAGIAAVFNAPIAGAFFALEVIMGNFAVSSFSPVILASVFATVVSRAYFGDHPAFIVQPYRFESLYEIPTYAGLGVVCGAIGTALIWTMDRFESTLRLIPVPRMWKPALGGVGLGLMIMFIPNLYGVGYGTMDAALRGDLPWQNLAVLVPAKMAATSLTLASGGSGGVFLPSLYIGAVAGELYGILVHAALPLRTAGAGAYALGRDGGPPQCGHALADHCDDPALRGERRLRNHPSRDDRRHARRSGRPGSRDGFSLHAAAHPQGHRAAPPRRHHHAHAHGGRGHEPGRARRA
jgi:CIC family chloride channel protein